MNDRSMIGWSALVIVSVIALAAILDKPSTARLDVKLALGALWVTNVGLDTVTITKIIGNNRTECRLIKGFWGLKQTVEGTAKKQHLRSESGRVTFPAIKIVSTSFA